MTALEGGADKAQVEGVVRRLWQGDVVAATVAAVLESPGSTFSPAVGELEPVDDSGLWVVTAQRIETGWAAIVTQTCDLVRHPDVFPNVQLMPIVNLDESAWEAALNGLKGGVFALPRMGGVPIDRPAIDCELSFPVSKAALAHDDIHAHASGLDPAGRILLSSWLMRRVGRFPFPDELEAHVLAPLRRRVTSAMTKNSQSGAFCRSLMGVWSSTEWAAGVSIFFVVDANRVAASSTNIDANKAISELLKPIQRKLGEAQMNVSVVASARTMENVSAHDLILAHRQVDMDALSTGSFLAAHDASPASDLATVGTQADDDPRADFTSPPA